MYLSVLTHHLSWLFLFCLLVSFTGLSILGVSEIATKYQLYRTADDYPCGDNVMSFGVTCLFGKIAKFWFYLSFCHLKSHPKICIEGRGWEGESFTSVQGIWCVAILLLSFPMEMSSFFWLVHSKHIRKERLPSKLTWGAIKNGCWKRSPYSKTPCRTTKFPAYISRYQSAPSQSSACSVSFSTQSARQK